MNNGAAAIDEQLAKIYNDPNDPGSFGGIERLFRRAKALQIPGISRAKVRSFLAGVPSYTLHRPARKHFRRNPIFARGIDDQWQADLVDMQALSRQNGGIKYLLTCIDVFSKFAWVVPVKAKSAVVITEAFQSLFNQASPRIPRKLQTDKGKEFLNTSVLSLLQRTYQVHHFTTWSDQKAAVVERFNRTLKDRMWRYFSARQTNHYLDVLPKLVEAYNNTWHRAIGMAPARVAARDESGIRKRLYGVHSNYRKSSKVNMSPPPPPPPPPEMDFTDALTKPNTMVRISRVKGVFEKGYKPNWSEEDFRVREVINRLGERRVYKLEDKMGEPIEGVWYREELQPITKNRYLVERVLRRRVNPETSERECLVEWRGWPKKFNSWVTERTLEEDE